MGMESNRPIPVLLNGSNYSYWSYLMKTFITGKEHWGYIDGSVVAPDGTDKGLLKVWNVNNAQILSWINISVEPSIGMHFAKFDTAKEVWDYLESIYVQSNFARRYELENILRSMRQDDKSAQEFYNVMNGIWDELDMMDPSELRNLAIYQKVRGEQKLVQFLMVLRSEFEPLRGSILHRSPLPSLENILSELVAEETRLKTSLLPPLSTQSVLVATQRPQFRPQSSTRGNQRVATDECNFCHEKGHWKKDCPKLRNKDKGILPPPHQTSHYNRNAFKPSSSGPISAFSSHSAAASSDRTFYQTAITHEEVQSLVAQQIQQLLGTSLGSQSPNSVAMSVMNTSISNLAPSGSTYREADWDRP